MLIKLKNRITPILFLSIGWLTPIIKAETKISDEDAELMTRAPSKKFASLVVTDNARIKHLHVTDKTHLDGHLDVNNNMSIENHLYVGGDEEIRKHLNVSGNEHVEGNITIKDNAIFKNDLIVKDNGIIKNRIYVDNDAILKQDAIIKDVLYVNKDLQVDDVGTFHQDLEVTKILHAEGNVDVDGNACIRNNLNIDKKLTVTYNQSVSGTATVGIDATTKEDVYVGGCETLAGDLTVQKNQNIVGSLTVKGNNECCAQRTRPCSQDFLDCCCQDELDLIASSTFQKSLNVGEDSLVSGNLNIKGNECLKGLLQVNGTIHAENIKTENLTIENLTVNQDAIVNGVLYTNEIDPTGDNSTTIFSGNVALNCHKKLRVGEINPALRIEYTCGGMELVEDENGVTCLHANTALPIDKTLLVNQINPVIVDDCGDCQSFDQGRTCFEGNVAICPGNTLGGIKKLLVNHIDPVKKNNCENCDYDHDDNAATSFSGNVAIMRTTPLPPPIVDDYNRGLYYQYDPCTPHEKLLVNTISPVIFDQNTQMYLPNQSTDAMTCFSGNVALSQNLQQTLYVNYIDPVITDTVTGQSMEDPNPCATTSFSGNVSIKNGHYFGQLNYECGSYDYGYQTRQPGADYQGLCLNCDRAEPVLRLTFNNVDPNQQPFPQGAWVKLNLLGKMHFNDQALDVFSQLYFFVGPGSDAPCSSFAGSINSVHPMLNTLSGSMCMSELPEYEFYQYQQFPFIPNLPTAVPSKFFGHTLFESMPQAIGSQSLFTLLGTTASSNAQRNVVDILLVAPFFFESFCVFINDVTIFYEIISPNLDVNNPPCVPSLRLDESVYNQAYDELLFKFFNALTPAP